MKAADSLDYTRVAPLDPKRFHFMEGTIVAGGVAVLPDGKLRDALMDEAAKLTKATSPLAANSDEIKRLKASGDDAERLKGKTLEQETTAAETALAQLTDEQTVERIEKEILDNPAKYPLLTKYYFRD